MTALAGLLVAALLWWGLKAFGRSDPRQLATVAKRAAGLAALAVAAALMLRGRLDMAVIAGGAGAWLLGWSEMPRIWPFSLFAARGGPSRHRGHAVEAEIDPRTGRLTGIVRAGPLAGRRLDDVDVPSLVRLRDACLEGDLDSARLIEAYLDGRAPGWREHAHAGDDARRGPELQGGAMSEQEAYEILGLEPGAQVEAVRAAHRALIKRLHPDRGGSTWLASRVNLAKDILLSRHR